MRTTLIYFIPFKIIANDILNFKFDEENENMIQAPPPVFSMRETPFNYR